METLSILSRRKHALNNFGLFHDYVTVILSFVIHWIDRIPKHIRNNDPWIG